MIGLLNISEVGAQYEFDRVHLDSVMSLKQNIMIVQIQNGMRIRYDDISWSMIQRNSSGNENTTGSTRLRHMLIRSSSHTIVYSLTWCTFARTVIDFHRVTARNNDTVMRI